MRRDANVKGEECDGTLQRARDLCVKQGGTAGRRLSLSEDWRFFVSAAVLKPLKQQHSQAAKLPAAANHDFAETLKSIAKKERKKQ